jgi:hypothetical protein
VDYDGSVEAEASGSVNCDAGGTETHSNNTGEDGDMFHLVDATLRPFSEHTENIVHGDETFS